MRIFLAAFSVPIAITLGCTTVIVSRQASRTGVPMLAHSADCINCDSRVALVPARDHAANTDHVMYGIGAEFPRAYNDRAAIYQPPQNKNATEPYARIPEVAHTYAMWESNYPLINEHGLVFGESSTVSTVPGGFGVDLKDPATGLYGEAKFSIKELMRVGLERCKTAVCAIEEMGATAVQYGFYPESVAAGESLTIADTLGDAWVFHISHDSTGTSAVWAAQRVPDGHVAAIANQYTIQDVHEDQPENYKFSSNMKSEAKKLGLWNGEGEFNWVKAYGNCKSKPSYTSIRLWGVYNLVAPGLKLAFVEDPFQLPFSVPVDSPIEREDLMNVFRTNYEDTEFDMTKGILSGAYGNPYRIEGGDGLVKVPGQFTRGVSIPRTTYTVLGYPDPKNPVAFYATDAPGSSVFVPFLAKTLQEASSSDLEATKALYSNYYQVGNRKDFSNHRDSAWWAFDFVANWMNMNYRNMSAQYVRPAVNYWQPKMIDASDSADTKTVSQAQKDLVEGWWNLADKLVVRYNDGYYNYPESDPATCHYMGYPAEYLGEIGFNNNFVRPQYVQPASMPIAADRNLVSGGVSWWMMVIVTLCAMTVGVAVGRKSVKVAPAQTEYQKRLLAGE